MLGDIERLELSKLEQLPRENASVSRSLAAVTAECRGGHQGWEPGQPGAPQVAWAKACASSKGKSGKVERGSAAVASPGAGLATAHVNQQLVSYTEVRSLRDGKLQYWF